MKTRKIVMAVVALTMCASSALAFASCKDKHEHEYVWTETVAPTCDTSGLAEGKCECGETTTKVLDPRHAYGEWQITNPTPTAAGKALKVCAANAEHTAEVTLPKLTVDGNGYTSLKEAENASGVPTRTYTLANENGDVVITTSAAITVGEAVKLGKYNNSKVVTADIKLKEEQYKPFDDLHGDEKRINPETGKEEVFNTYANKFIGVIDDEYSEILREEVLYICADSEIDYEFGDNYVHIKDGSMSTEGYYSLLAGGKLFPVLNRYTDVDKYETTKDNGATEEIFKGYGYGFSYYLPVENVTKQFGVTEFLNALYVDAQQNLNGHFTEAVKEVEGKIVYSFTYDVYFDGFHVINVDFTVDGNGVVDSASITSTDYSTLYVTEDTYEDESGELQQLKASLGIVDVDAATGYYEFHHNEKYNTSTSKYWKNRQTFTVTQKTEYGAGVAVPTNPYNYDDFVMSSFDLTVVDGATKVEGEDKYTAVATNAITMQIENYTPDTVNFYFDTPQVYLKTSQGNVLLSENYEDGADGHIAAAFNRSAKTLTLNFRIAGTHELLIKTEKCEKTFTVEVPFADPGVFKSNVYQYNEVTEKSTWNNTSSTFTVYENQPLYVTSWVQHPAYENAGFTIEDVDGLTITDATKEGVSVKKITAAAAGEYYIMLTPDSETAMPVMLTIIVEEAPAMADLLKGDYSNNDAEIITKLTPSAEGALSGTFEVTVDDGTTTLNYAYANGVITLTNATGGHANYNFGLEISESYNLFLTYTNQFNKNVKVLLTTDGSMPNLILGDHTLFASFNDDDRGLVAGYDIEAMEVTESGNYTITVNYKYINYQINDNDPVANFGDDYWPEDVVMLQLKAGDKLKVWGVLGNSGTYNVKLASKPLNEEVDVKVGLTLVVGASANLLIGEGNGLTWESSNNAVATVNNGVVTAVSAGKAFITVSDGTNSITIAITVRLNEFNVTGITSATDAGNVTLTFKGDANTKYEFTSSDPSLKLIIGSDNAYGVISGTTDANGNLTLTVTATEFSEFTIAAAKDEGNGITSGSGTSSDPYVITAGKKVKVNNVPDYNDWYASPMVFVIEIVEEGEYTLLGSDNAAACLYEEDPNDPLLQWVGDTWYLSAGTYYVQLYSNDGSPTANITVKKA